MTRFTITFYRNGVEETTRLFAEDAKAAIDELLNSNKDIEPKGIVSVTPSRPLAQEQDKTVGGESDKKTMQAGDEDEAEENKSEGYAAISSKDVEGTNWKKNSLILGLSLFLGVSSSVIMGENLKGGSFTVQNREDSYESEWDSYPVDFRSLREDAQNDDAHIVQGTNFAIENRYGYRNYVQEKKDGTRWAMVKSLSNRLAISSWIVDCDEKQVQVEYALAEEPEEWKKPKKGTQGFAVAATICKIPFTPSY